MKTGYHAVYEDDYYTAIDNAAENGFDFVQFDLGIPRFYLDGLSDADLSGIRDHAGRKDVEITFHAPGDNVSLFCDYPAIRDGIMRQFKMIVKKANKLGARHITVHAGNHPGFKKSGSATDYYTGIYKDYYEDILCGNLKDLILCSEKSFICLENCNFNQLVMNVAEKLIKGGYALYLTLDTAKMFASCGRINDDVFRFSKEYRRNIREIHIHDLSEQFGSHQIVGAGTIDFTLFEEFMRSDSVYLNFEVRPLESAIKSRDALNYILSNKAK